jgi:hypothetical protein
MIEARGCPICEVFLAFLRSAVNGLFQVEVTVSVDSPTEARFSLSV